MQQLLSELLNRLIFLRCGSIQSLFRCDLIYLVLFSLQMESVFQFVGMQIKHYAKTDKEQQEGSSSKLVSNILMHTLWATLS